MDQQSVLNKVAGDCLSKIFFHLKAEFKKNEAEKHPFHLIHVWP